LEGIAGVVIYGGMDIDPAFYGEQVSASIQRYDLRDANEIALIQYCIANNIPLFGICRGMQLINVALGGTMYQDINQFVPKTTLIHDLTRDDHNKLSHSVNAKSQSFLHQATGLSQFMVNSFHHQAIKTLGKDLEVVATSDDGVIEAIQHSE
jgi:gamma-glutamyl-gamma-aminobutyrate hydrolase PuuD